MPTVLQLRRGTTAEHSTFTGAEGEVTVNTTKDTIVVHDGSTQGGFEVALADATNLNGVEVSNFDAAAIQTGSEAFTDSDTVLMTAAAVQDKIESYGYITSSTADISSVTAGDGLSGGGSSGDVTLTVDLTDTNSFTTTNTASKAVVRDASGDFAAGTITADLTGNVTGDVTGNADTATTLTSLTATVTELNYVDGVTSNIQTQLDAKLASASYTAADVLTKIKTVDGTGSGLDADTLDGNEATAFATAAQGALADSAIQNLGDLSITATATELNTLDGITATTAELNYVDGVTSAIQTQLDAKAPSASPTFTGTPTAPTATAGANTTQIATTAFVATAVANVIDSAPGALDTLNELAAALGDDANFSTTVTNSIATKLNSSAVSAFGLTLVDDADAATARTTLGLGTAATTASTDYATAAQGTLADSAVQNLADLSITATAAEINKLDGVTATTAELNYVDGVTSAIQTQIDNNRIDIYDSTGTLLN
jgi:hypothetical protein